MSPLAITLLWTEFPPEERGTALGALGIPILLAPALGPTLGGYIVTFLGWRLIFFINVSIGILGTIFLRQGQREARAPFDIPGFICASIGLASLLYGLSEAGTDGWSSGTVLGFMGLGIVVLAIFVVVELTIVNRGGRPLLDLRVFVNGPFTTSIIASSLVVFALYGGLFIIPIYLQELRGLSAFRAGLLLLPQAFASMVTSVIGGRLVDKLGVRAVIIPGLIILAFALWVFTSIGANTPYGTVQIWLIIRSLALGLTFQPLAVSALSEMSPRQLPGATAVNTTARFVISSLAVAVIATLVQTQTSVHYTHLAELVTPASPLGQLVPGIQALLVQQGASASQSYQTAIQYLTLLVQQQANVLAMQDAFWVSLALTVAAIISAFFVRSRRPQARPGRREEQPLTDEERAESEAARTEALSAI